MYYSLAKARGDTVQQDIAEMVVGHLGTDIESIHMFRVFFVNTSLYEIANVIKHPVRLIVVALVFPNDVLDLFLHSISLLVTFLPFQYFIFCT